MENRSSRINDLLIYALNNLSQEEFKGFKDKLSHSDFEGKGNIPRGWLEYADRIDAKNLLMAFYGGDAAVDVAIEVFNQINLREAAANLREERENGKKPKVPIKPGSLPKESALGQQQQEQNEKQADDEMINSKSKQEARGAQSRDAQSGPDSLTAPLPFFQSVGTRRAESAGSSPSEEILRMQSQQSGAQGVSWTEIGVEEE